MLLHKGYVYVDFRHGPVASILVTREPDVFRSRGKKWNDFGFLGPSDLRKFLPFSCFMHHSVLLFEFVSGPTKQCWVTRSPLVTLFSKHNGRDSKFNATSVLPSDLQKFFPFSCFLHLSVLLFDSLSLDPHVVTLFTEHERQDSGGTWI